MEAVKVKILREGAVLPTYGSEGAAGTDLYACLNAPMEIAPGETVFIPTGLAMAIPEGLAGLVYARSGMACKRGLAPANKVGVIDSDYRGEIMVALLNHGSQTQQISHGDRIAQLLLTPVMTPSYDIATDLDETHRASGGFGSTGK